MKYIIFILWFIVLSIPGKASNKYAIIAGGSCEFDRSEDNMFKDSTKSMTRFLVERNWNTEVFWNGNLWPTESFKENLCNYLGKKSNDPSCPPVKKFTNLKGQFFKHLENLYDDKVKEGDQVLLYFNTHGKVLDSGDDFHQICAGDNENISMKEINEWVQKFKQDKKVKILVLDYSCYSGSTLKMAGEDICVQTGSSEGQYSWGIIGVHQKELLEGDKAPKNAFAYYNGMIEKHIKFDNDDSRYWWYRPSLPQASSDSFFLLDLCDEKKSRDKDLASFCGFITKYLPYRNQNRKERGEKLEIDLDSCQKEYNNISVLLEINEKLSQQKPKPAQLKAVKGYLRTIKHLLVTIKTNLKHYLSVLEEFDKTKKKMQDLKLEGPFHFNGKEIYELSIEKLHDALRLEKELKTMSDVSFDSEPEELELYKDIKGNDHDLYIKINNLLSKYNDFKSDNEERNGKKLYKYAKEIYKSKLKIFQRLNAKANIKFIKEGNDSEAFKKIMACRDFVF